VAESPVMPACHLFITADLVNIAPFWLDPTRTHSMQNYQGTFYGIFKDFDPFQATYASERQISLRQNDARPYRQRLAS
jgi:hypothetical protein